MNNEKVNMKENRGQPKNVSSCFEGQACAEMMQKILGEKRIGSLCAELMRSMIKDRREAKERSQEAKPAQGRDDENNAGGVK